MPILGLTVHVNDPFVEFGNEAVNCCLSFCPRATLCGVNWTPFCGFCDPRDVPPAQPRSPAATHATPARDASFALPLAGRHVHQTIAMLPKSSQAASG